MSYFIMLKKKPVINLREPKAKQLRRASRKQARREKGNEKECSQQLAANAARREPGEKERRKNSALSDWLPMLPGRKPGKNQRRKGNALSNWL